MPPFIVADDSYIDFLIFCFMRWVGEINDQTTTVSFRDYFENPVRKLKLEEEFTANSDGEPLDIWFDPAEVKEVFH
tara:strand:+ start:941 stop:1168 length:228 start_codon:yes stop_codon:yes gene_type:complete